MSESPEPTLAQKVTATFIDIDPEEVFEDARELGMEVSQIEDFRAFDNDDNRITELMDEYVKSTASSSAFTGMTTGLGGVTTTVLLGGADLISVSIKLYRLSQRLAVLKGFDPRQSLSKEKCQSIYLRTLGLNAATQAVLRKQMMRATTVAGEKKASQNTLLKLIVWISKLLGKKLSYKNAGRLVPVVGSAAGAWINYKYTQRAGNTMIAAFKEERAQASQ